MVQSELAIAAFQHFKDHEGDMSTNAATLIHDPKFVEGIDGVSFEDGVLKLG